MNPNNKETNGMQLPPPVAEQVPAGQAAEADAASAEQLPAASLERAPAAGQAAPPPASLPLPVPPPAQPVPPASGVSASATASLTADDDGDLIEKEWVTRAKQIVDRNRDDPYKQSEELTVFKADYMKKRYGKTIKVNQ